MVTEISEDLIRVVVLDISGVYTLIYDELYCSKEKYNDVLIKYDKSDKYKIVII